MTNTIEGLYNLREEDTVVQIGNGKKLKSTTVGTLKTIAQQLDGTTIDVKLSNVVYVPELSFNLFSITKAMENGFQVSSCPKAFTTWLFSSHKCVFYFRKGSFLLYSSL